MSRIADKMVGNEIGVVRKDGSTAYPQGSTFPNANFDTITAMKARLQALDASTFTTARLNTMTVNDMVYALRVHDLNAGSGAI